jgi:hypothetical protein
MAGLGGGLVSPVSAIVPGMDVEVIINAFIVVYFSEFIRGLAPLEFDRTLS